ncbi:hypothetical protein ACI6QG_18220 [Roseococcus sp. DSY-14]|uniref:hypothetical protein n=1 Tax=Roseococcus sp. DSY-14 TaxID=3369650 RepID=UPI00387A8C9F
MRRRAMLGLGAACLACRPLAATPLACLDGDDGAADPAAQSVPPRLHAAARGADRAEARWYPGDPVHGGADAATARAAAQAGLDALGAFRRAGFPPARLHGGVLRIELRNLQGARGGASPAWRHIVVERLLAADALRETVFHEVFHLVQHACNATPATLVPEGAAMVFTPMQREGGARVMERLAGTGRLRLEEDAQDWFRPEGLSLGSRRRPPRGGLQGPNYAGGLFWHHVAARHGGAVATQRALLEATRAPGPVTLEVLRAARARMAGPGDFDRFLAVGGDPALPAGQETCWGDFLVALALNGTAGGDGRFRLDGAEGWRGITGRRARPAREAEWDALPLAWETPDLPPFGFRILRLALPPGPATRLLRLRVEGPPGALAQLALLDPAAELRDLLRWQGAVDRVVPLRDLSEAVLVLATREAGGRLRVTLEEAPAAPVLFSAGWNAQDGRHLTHDPLVRAHDFRSPDVGFDPVPVREAGAEPFWLLLLSLRNRGTLDCPPPEARAEWRPLEGGEWRPLPLHRAPPALRTADHCAALLDSEAPVTRADLPCVLENGRLSDPEPRFDRATAIFRWTGGDVRRALLRFTARAGGDPNGALTVLASFGGPPPLSPLP